MCSASAGKITVSAFPSLLALRERGFRVSAAGTGACCAFFARGPRLFSVSLRQICEFPCRLDGPWNALEAFRRTAPRAHSELRHQAQFAGAPGGAQKARGAQVVRTINGLGWIYSSRSLKAFALSPVYRALHRLAARSTAATLFQNRDDMTFFERHGLLGKGNSRLIPGRELMSKNSSEPSFRVRRATSFARRSGSAAARSCSRVTRLTRQKGIPTLLEAAALVREARPGVRFLLVGPRQSEGPLAIADRSSIATRPM